ncbi:MAG: hypothetical protein AAF901_11875, partial [Bacteroidota bacterium]
HCSFFSHSNGISAGNDFVLSTSLFCNSAFSISTPKAAISSMPQDFATVFARIFVFKLSRRTG